MKKFFLFKRRDVNLASTAVSDSGEGLDVLAIPTDSLSFMTASYVKILIVFNDATIYEESNLLDGQSFKKTSVSVSCAPGSEADLVEDILKFISSEKTTSNIMRFDAVLGKTTASKAIVSDFTDVVSEVKQFPVSRVTQESSTSTFIGGTLGTAFGTGSTIADIDFGEGNKPSLDYHEGNISESAGNVTGWTNAGTAVGYDISTIVGTVEYNNTTGRTGNGLATATAQIGTPDNLTLPSTYSEIKEFTFFCVLGRSESDIRDSKKIGFIAQGSTNSNLMFMDPLVNNVFKFKFRGEKGDFVTANASADIVTEDRTAYVFVVRRDAYSNVFVHDATGSVVAIAEANTSGYSRTDGEFNIRYIGNGVSEKFQGNVARLGVISKDIGTSAGSKLALDLAKKYTPIT
jgi:hypothetical protein